MYLCSQSFYASSYLFKSQSYYVNSFFFFSISPLLPNLHNVCLENPDCNFSLVAFLSLRLWSETLVTNEWKSGASVHSSEILKSPMACQDQTNKSLYNVFGNSCLNCWILELIHTPGSSVKAMKIGFFNSFLPV